MPSLLHTATFHLFLNSYFRLRYLLQSPSKMPKLPIIQFYYYLNNWPPSCHFEVSLNANPEYKPKCIIIAIRYQWKKFKLLLINIDLTYWGYSIRMTSHARWTTVFRRHYFKTQYNAVIVLKFFIYSLQVNFATNIKQAIFFNVQLLTYFFLL